MQGSHVRYSAAGLLIAVGLMLGGTGGVALADPITHHDRHHDGPGGFGRTGSPGEGQSSSGPKRGLAAGPRSRVGDGRGGMPRQQLGRGYGQPAGGSESAVGSEQSGREETGGVTLGGVGWGGGYRDGNLSRPTIHLPFPSPTDGGGWPGVRWPGIYSAWGTFQLPTVANLFAQPQPQPQPQPTPQQKIAGAQPTPQQKIAGAQPEPVNSTGGGGGGEAPEPAVAEPPVVRAPLVVAPVIPAPRVPPAPVLRPPVVPAPATGPNAGVVPRAPAEPPRIGPPPRIGQSVAPAPPPLATGSPTGAQAPVRAGYSDYLRNAETAQLAAVALPGVAGLVFLTASGGLLGYRQAKAGQSMRSPSIGRFLR